MLEWVNTALTILCQIAAHLSNANQVLCGASLSSLSLCDKGTEVMQLSQGPASQLKWWGWGKDLLPRPWELSAGGRQAEALPQGKFNQFCRGAGVGYNKVR